VIAPRCHSVPSVVQGIFPLFPPLSSSSSPIHTHRWPDTATSAPPSLFFRFVKRAAIALALGNTASKPGERKRLSAHSSSSPSSTMARPSPRFLLCFLFLIALPVHGQ
jgi:hypothetical protein